MGGEPGGQALEWVGDRRDHVGRQRRHEREKQDGKQECREAAGPDHQEESAGEHGRQRESAHRQAAGGIARREQRQPGPCEAETEP